MTAFLQPRIKRLAHRCGVGALFLVGDTLIKVDNGIKFVGCGVMGDFSEGEHVYIGME